MPSLAGSASCFLSDNVQASHWEISYNSDKLLFHQMGINLEQKKTSAEYTVYMIRYQYKMLYLNSLHCRSWIQVKFLLLDIKLYIREKIACVF